MFESRYAPEAPFQSVAPRERRGNAKQRCRRKHGRSLLDRPDFTREPKTRQVLVKKIGPDPPECRNGAQVFNIRLGKPEMLEILERLLEPGCDEIRAIGRQLTHVQLEGGCAA